jgi:glucan phosphoethanolaminetransferase (alkaline phosphatase superfamily)
MNERLCWELLSLFLAILAGVLYTLVLHLLTVIVPSPNHVWLDHWSIPIALASSVGVFLVGSLWRWAFFVSVNLSLCLAGLAGYFIGAKSIIINDEVFAAVLETTPSEASEFISNKLLVTLFLTLALGLSVTIPYLRCYRPNFAGFLSRSSLAALIFIVICATVRNPLGASVDVFLPAAFGTRAYEYYLKRAALIEQVRNQFDIASLPSSMDPKTSDFTLILVIGESARADHLSLNGYSRNTNPFTRELTGLVNFKDVMSCGAITRISVPCLFTRATVQNRATQLHTEFTATEASLLNLTKKHGFHTTWISMNKIYGNNVPISAIADTADQKIFDSWNANDSYLLPRFHNIVRKYEAGRQLIVVHLVGSHFDYSKRYPANFGAFKPDHCKRDMVFPGRDSDGDDRCTINAYDNSIRFTDYMLFQFIEDLRDREALLFYVSDHGESLGEADERGQVYWEHGQPERIEQRIVPMQVWASDRFIAKYPERFASLRRHATTPLSHDHFFHSVLDCIGIHSDIVDKHLSLCTQGDFTERNDVSLVVSSGGKIEHQLSTALLGP